MDVSRLPAPALLSVGVAERLETYILAGGFGTGDRLPSERDLAATFGVSRTAVREAVKLLSQRGLVRSDVGRGLFVGEGGTASILASLNVLLHLGGARLGDIVDVREALETTAARLATINATDAEIGVMGQTLDTMRAYQAEGGERFRRAGTRFHLQLARASHNPVLHALLEPTMTLMMRAKTLVGVGPGVTPEGMRNHERIFAAVAVRDADAAAVAVAHHCAHLRQLYAHHQPEWAASPFVAERDADADADATATIAGHG